MLTGDPVTLLISTKSQPVLAQLGMMPELIPPLKITIETGLENMADDEYLEVTQKNVRLRKKFLKETDRKRV